MSFSVILMCLTTAESEKTTLSNVSNVAAGEQTVLPWRRDIICGSKAQNVQITWGPLVIVVSCKELLVSVIIPLWLHDDWENTCLDPIPV